MGSLLLNQGVPVVYFQLHIIDAEEATMLRMQKNPKCLQVIIVDLQIFLISHHALYEPYKQAHERVARVGT